MALSTIDTNQIKDGGVTNTDLKASTAGNPFRTNATSITSDLTVASGKRRATGNNYLLQSPLMECDRCLVVFL